MDQQRRRKCRSSRRSLIAGAAAVSLAGCLTSSNDPNESSLGTVVIFNLHDEPHTIDLRVEWDGELVHDRTYDLEGDDPDVRGAPEKVPERTWPGEPGQFTISARLDGGEWWIEDPEDRDYPDCFSPNVMVDRNGVFGIDVMTDRKWCDDDERDPVPPDQGDGPDANESVDSS